MNTRCVRIRKRSYLDLRSTISSPCECTRGRSPTPNSALSPSELEVGFQPTTPESAAPAECELRVELCSRLAYFSLRILFWLTFRPQKYAYAAKPATIHRGKGGTGRTPSGRFVWTVWMGMTTNMRSSPPSVGARVRHLPAVPFATRRAGSPPACLGPWVGAQHCSSSAQSSPLSPALPSP